MSRHKTCFTSTEKHTQHDLRCQEDSAESNHPHFCSNSYPGRGNNTKFPTTWSSGGGTEGGGIKCDPTFFDLLIKNSDLRQKSSPDVPLIGPSEAGEVTRVLASFPLNLGPILDNSSGLWMAVCPPPPFHQPTHYSLYYSPEANWLTTLLLCGLISCVWCEHRTSFLFILVKPTVDSTNHS